MATPQDLDRLRALLGQLVQIGDARRGELIRAEDWNLLVGALADVARSVLAADPSAAVPPHQHPEQVDAAWLTPQLRELLERGPLADPAMQQRLTKIEQTVRRLGEAQDGSEGKIEEFRGRLTDVASRDLERQSAITAVRRQLDTVVDPRSDLQAMRTTLGAVQRDISTVLDAASRLSIDGQVVDVELVLGRIDGLEQFRERMRLANGELLDAASVERRLAEVQQSTVTPGRLSEALNAHQFELSAAQAQALEDRIGTRQREQTNAALASFRTEIDTRVNSRLDGIGTLVQSRVAEALPGVESRVQAAVGNRIDAAQQAAITAAQLAAQRAIDAGVAGVRTDLGARIDAVGTGLASQVETQVATRLASSLAAISSRIDGQSSRLDTLAGQSAQLAETQRSHASQLATLPQDLAGLRNDLRSSLLGEINLQVTALNRSLSDRLTEFARDNDLRLNAVRAEISAQAVDAARRAAIEASQSSSAALRTQLLAEMRGIARDELNLAVNDAVRTQVDRAVSAQFATVPNLVSEEVRRQRLVTPRDTGVLTPVTPVSPVVVNPGRITG